MNFIQAIRNDAKGAALLADWLGEGGEPVSQDVAETRAAVCVPCPENRLGDWWLQDIWDDVKTKIASVVRKQLELKNNLQLRLSVESGVGTCRVCGCNLKLLPWTPLKHLKAHTPVEQIKQYPTGCWKREELQT